MNMHAEQRNAFMRTLALSSNIINQLTEYVIAAMMGAMTIVISLQVFTRYVLNDPLTWTEEISRYLMVWVCFLGSAMALKYGEHISVSFIQERLPPRPRRALALGLGLTVLAFFLLATWEGVLMTLQVMDQQAPATWISMAWAYSCIPVGCGFMAIHTLVQLIESQRNPSVAGASGTRVL